MRFVFIAIIIASACADNLLEKTQARTLKTETLEAYQQTRKRLMESQEENQKLEELKEKLEKDLELAREKLKEHEEQEELSKLDSKISDCKKYTEAYRVSACASGLLRDGLIDNTEYQHFLFDSMRKAKAEESSYYSCGVEWGDERSVVCGRQDIYEFDSVYAKIPLRLPYFGKHEKIMHRLKAAKPRLLYSFSDIDAPEFTIETWKMYRPSSVGRLNHLWRSDKAKKISTLPIKNCAGVENKMIKAFEDWTDGTLLAPSDLWCPDMLTSKFEIIIGSYEKKNLVIKGSAVETYVAKWEFSLNERKSYGPVPKHLLDE